MKVEVLPTGPLATNCYLVYLEDKRTLYIIDPGADPESIAARAGKYDACVQNGGRSRLRV